MRTYDPAGVRMSTSMPELTSQYLLRFPGFSQRTSVCHLFLANRGVVLGELEDNEGTSVTNALEIVCAGIAEEFFAGSTDFAVYQWLPRDVFTTEGRMLEIHWHAPGFRLPEWCPVIKLPDYAREAESQIRRIHPYTYEFLRKQAIEGVELDRAQQALQRIRTTVPALASASDRPPMPCPPELTSGERDVLLALARPLAKSDAPPLTSAQIAAELSLTVAAVEAVLKTLFEKLEVPEYAPARRREQLVHDAIDRRVITRTDLLDVPDF